MMKTKNYSRHKHSRKIVMFFFYSYFYFDEFWNCPTVCIVHTSFKFLRERYYKH